MTAPDRDLRGWAGPAAGLSFVAGVAGAALRASDPYPRPWTTPSEVQTYFTGNRAAAGTTGALAAASLATSAACSLLLTTRTARDPDAAHRLHQLGFTAGGPVHTVAFGALVGTLASGPPRRAPRTGC